MIAMRFDRRLCAAALAAFAACTGALASSYPITVGQPAEVPCGSDTIGTVTIDTYRTSLNVDAGINYYGAEIQGGFDLNITPPADLDPAAQWRWVSAVKGPPPLYGWQNANTWYIDRTRKVDDPMTPADESKIVADGSPFYVNLRGPGYGHSTLGFYDLPQDNRTPIDLMFETALVCFKGMNIYAVCSFSWGFKRANAAGPTTLYDLTFNETVSDDLIGAFQNDPDPMFATWTIQKGCCLIPAPATAGLLGLGLLTVTRRRRAA